ncbi:hypothetical protein AB0A98_06355 [Streptomyces chrestomyceticus]|uniref:hypothetical protein n=1 Tax=Streptomyces chrestomyceticus TaxID=68185 RepID=UPI0034052C50
MASDNLRTTALISPSTSGVTDATATRRSDTLVIATVPAACSAWADFALASHTALRPVD